MAQKSTSTGRSAFKTSASKVSSVTARTAQVFREERRGTAVNGRAATAPRKAGASLLAEKERIDVAFRPDMLAVGATVGARQVIWAIVFKWGTWYQVKAGAGELKGD